MDRSLLIRKFRRLAAGVMASEDQNRLLAAVEGLPDLKNLDPILGCLGKPIGGRPKKMA